MKNRIVALSALWLVVISTVRAQNVDFGLTAGFQFSTGYTVGNSLPNSSIRTGILAGGHASLFLNERIVIKSALLFSQKGMTMTREEDDERRIIANDYLTLPIVAKLYITKGFHVQIGPQASYLVTSNSKLGDRKFNLKRADYLKPIDFGVVFGLGYEFKSTFTFALNFDVGLINVIDNRETFEAHMDGVLEWRGIQGNLPERLSNTTFQFVFGYNFTKNRSAF